MPRTPVLGLPYPALSESPDGPAQFKALADALDGADPQASGAFIIGEIRHIAVDAAPPGWLEANGAARSRSTYSRLFAVIGTAFGAGDGTSTFNVPDCRGRALIAAGQGPGLANRQAGATGGAEGVALDVNQLPSHNHGGQTGAVDLNHTHGNTGDDSPDHAHGGIPGNSPVRLFVGGGGIDLGTFNYAVAGATGGASARHVHATGWMDRNNPHGHSIPAQGAGQTHDNMPPHIVIPAYIFAGA